MNESYDPADDFDQRRAVVRAVAEDRLWTLLWWWLVGNGLFAAFFCCGGCAGAFRRGDTRFLIPIGVMWFWSLAVGGAAAWLTFRNWSVLKRRWIMFGLAPWGVLVIETTLMIVMAW